MRTYIKYIKVGFIGAGNMGGALATAVTKAGYRVCVYDKDEAKTAALSEKIGAKVLKNANDVIFNCTFVFLGVKPQMLEELAKEIRPLLDEMGQSAPILISMAAGTSIARLKELFGDRFIVRIMPNTPVSVGKGMTLWCASDNMSVHQTGAVEDILSQSGRLDHIDEKLIDAASAVSGCGPAFVYMFAEALADGGVLCGLPRDKALTYAAQTLAGAAEYLMASGEHPGKLKDNVCSPGGTTIEGVRTLEACSFRSAATEAVIAAYEKTLTLAKK
jgi:pyrroline-5-carboxylate reductase